MLDVTQIKCPKNRLNTTWENYKITLYMHLNCFYDPQN